MGDFIDVVSNVRPPNTQIQENRGRANQQPAITDAKDSAVQAQNTADAALLQPPIGTVNGWAGPSDPPGGTWLVCDGRLLSQDDYPALFSAISTYWNTGGEGSNQFRIPDLRSRVPVGAGQSAGLSNRSMGNRFGEEQHVLTLNEMPYHSHDITVYTDGSHQHFYDEVVDVTRATIVAGSSAQSAQPVFGLVHNTTSTTSAGTHYHIANAKYVGSNSPVNNVQPSLAMNFIIRAT